MTNQIEIPTYRTLIPNSTFSKDAKSIRHPMIGNISVTQIMQIARYTIPTEDDVIDLIQTAARDSKFSMNTDKYSDEIPLLKFMEMLPPNELEKIIQEEKEILSHARLHCSPGNYEPGQTYLQILNGLIPNKILDSTRELCDEKGYIAYQELITKGGIKEDSLGMRLNGKDSLPDKSEIEYLLEREVTDCNIFKANGNYGEYQNIADQIRLLYNALPSSGDVRKIKDDSNIFLESKATNTIRTLAMCLSTKKAFNTLAEGLGGIFGQAMQDFSQKSEKKKGGFDLGSCEFSPN